jgi:hypothetical protein
LQEGQNLGNIETHGNMHFLLVGGRAPPYPTLSVLIPNLGKIAKRGKMHFLLVSGRAQGYPTLSVLIPNHGKNAKPGKMHFLWFQKHKKNDEISKTTFLGNAEK